MKIPKRVRQNEGYMSFWTKEEVAGISQVDKKEQTFGKQVLAGLPRNMGWRGIWWSRVWLGFSLSVSLN